MLDLQDGEVISREVAERVEQAEVLLARVSRRREFAYAEMALMLSGCKAAWMKRLGCFADRTQKDAIKVSMTSPTKRPSLSSAIWMI